MTRVGSVLRDERGSITPLAIIYAVIALAAGLLLFAAADLYLAQKQLYTQADAAALAAANSFAIEDIAVAGGDPQIRLDHEDALAAAQNHLAAHGDDEITITQIAVTGEEVALTVGGQWRAEMGGLFFPTSVPLEVQVTARAQFE